jgi:putative aldouronate transport system permease protein
LIPFLNLLATSLSSKEAVDAGEVGLIPVNFSVDAYRVLITKADFFRAFGISVERVILGTLLSVAVITLGAFPLSRSVNAFKGRRFYTVYFTITMFFSGGLVPTYIVITKLHLTNTMFALILPTAMNAWNMVLLINFFRQVPKELEEAAKIEGAGHYRILTQIILPVSLPALATVTLFTAVQHWNAWFDGIIYMNKSNFPLQSYIYNMINESSSLRSQLVSSAEDVALISNLPTKTLESAQIFIAILPILPIYPFAQKYFIKGLVMGSVKE